MKLSIEKIYDKGSGKFNEDEILIKKTYLLFLTVLAV